MISDMVNPLGNPEKKNETNISCYSLTRTSTNYSAEKKKKNIMMPNICSHSPTRELTNYEAAVEHAIANCYANNDELLESRVHYLQSHWFPN